MSYPDNSSTNAALPGAVDFPAIDPLTPAPTKPVPPPPTVPAGWYPDPDNHNGFRFGGTPSVRYFDGSQWTENRAPMPPQQRQQGQPQIVVTQQVATPTPPVVVLHGGTNHGLHLLLTLLTCGAWLPIWIILVIVNGGR